MHYKLKKISPHSVALHSAIIFAVMALVFMLPFAFLMTTVTPDISQQEVMPFVATGIMTFVMPVIYFIFTYIFTFLMALLYNLITKLTGGVKVTLEADE
jgi:hypothetical protein